MGGLRDLADEAAALAAGPTTSGTGAPVETIDVAPVNAKARRSLYKSRVKIHPKRAQGSFRKLKWIVMAVTLSIYYLAPWIRWDRGPIAPDQAILVDFPARRFYFFFIEIWPQEVYYFTGLLILAALVLFLMTSLAGRVWCGYSCPQTVWTDLFVAVERRIEGDRNARIKLDRGPWTLDKLRKRAVKHTAWLVIGVLTGGAWVFYFADAPTLAAELARFEAPAAAYLFIAALTFTTYTLGGHAREQVCTYMCPWPRIQGAMFDEDSYLVTYRDYRGEPRGAHKRGESWEGRGHCVDCNQCVAVCPMGIDIRDGAQLECIQCALCIDACNGVMERVGLPHGLIAYDNYRSLAAQARGQTAKVHLVRPRTAIYAVLIVVVGLVMLYALVTRPNLELNVLRDRNPLFVTLSDGSIRNGYTVKILNKLREQRTLELSSSGPAGARLTSVGPEVGQGGGGDAEGMQRVVVEPDGLRSLKVYVTAPRDALDSHSTPIRFEIRDPATGDSYVRESSFMGPER